MEREGEALMAAKLGTFALVVILAALAVLLLI